MRLKKLLRKNIEPRCTYCAHGSPLADGERIACRKCGVVNGNIVTYKHFTDADFSLGDTDEEQ